MLLYRHSCNGDEWGHFLPAAPAEPVDLMVANAAKHEVGAAGAGGHGLGPLSDSVNWVREIVKNCFYEL
jgi:hypothetical protein